MWKGQTKDSCDIFEKGCYYDGSSLRGKNDKIVEMFLESGEKPLWKYLEKYYKEVFGNQNIQQKGDNNV